MEACEDVYACGDIVRFPLPLVGSTASIGHWQIAHNHGNKSFYNKPYNYNYTKVASLH